MNKPSNTSEDILACARTLIASGGYNGFSYADIAQVVSIRKASIHHHFPAKVDLVKALIARYRQDTEAGVAYIEGSAPGALDQLRAYVQYWKTCIGDGSSAFCVCAMLASELPILPHEVALEVRSYFRFLSGWLASLLERGAQQGLIVLGSGDARSEAEAFMATVHGAMLSARAYGDPAVFGVIMDQQLFRLAAKP